MSPASFIPGPVEPLWPPAAAVDQLLYVSAAGNILSTPSGRSAPRDVKAPYKGSISKIVHQKTSTNLDTGNRENYSIDSTTFKIYYLKEKLNALHFQNTRSRRNVENS